MLTFLGIACNSTADWQQELMSQFFITVIQLYAKLVEQIAVKIPMFEADKAGLQNIC